MNPKLCSMVLLTAFAIAAPSRADEPRDPMGAEAAFSDARRLMKEGRFDEACPKLETSYRLDPALGSLLNLAECFARTGRTASAWLRYREAAGMALREGQKERETIARERAAALEPQLCRLIVRAPETIEDVRRDGILLGLEHRGQAVPIDPGAHVVEAKAPGLVPFVTRVEIVRGRSTEAPCKSVIVDVPADLGGRLPPRDPPIVAAPPPRVESAPLAPRWTAQHTLSIVSAGAGIVALGIGAAFALDAASTERNADALCRPEGCPEAGRDGHAEAGRRADIATASVVTGAVFLVGGTVLWLTAPSLRRTVVPARGVAIRF